ncbi:MAG: SpoIIE family protein phosphatase [candidate division Zixibacteria bacterium]|nr:SpoIIE family protein phosphatase [candidate division Zixibacteria bacterium]
MYRLSSPQYGNRHDWQLEPGTYVIGRVPPADLMVNDATVSRRHAQLDIAANGKIRLTDLASLNGTLVNDRKITGSVDVKVGDAITFGTVGFLISSSETAIPKPEVAVTDGVESHTSMSSLPIDEALQPLALKDYTNPRIFKAISDMAKMLILPQSADEMFSESLALLQDIVHAERAAVFLAREGSETLTLVTFRLSDQKGSDSFTISRSIVREVLDKKMAVLFSDLISDERFAKQESIVVSGIRSAMAVPLINEQKVLGILYTDTADPWQRFNEESLKITATFGNILAAKIINQGLLKERQEKEALESELRIASQIQEELMPKVLPVVPGYAFHAFQMQCKMVGGDLYDAALLRDGRVLILLADVSGKGMGAALLASNILSAFRMLRGNTDFDVAEATTRVNAQLHASSRSGDFATAFLALLDANNHTLTYVNAGHNSPLLVRNDGTIEYIEATGMPIGVFDGVGWESRTIALAAGDRLLVFTDGIPEAINVTEDFYSDERLEKFTVDHRAEPPDIFATALIADVSNFVGDAPRSDDITLILLQREL